MMRAKSDICLFYKKIEGKQIDNTGQNSADFLSFGIKDIIHLADKALQRFESIKRECHDITFAGIMIVMDSFLFCLSQAHYRAKLRIFPKNATYVD